MRLRWQLAAMMATGTLFAWSFPPYDLWPCIVIALAPLLSLCGQVSARRLGLLGAGASLVGSGWLVPWLFDTLRVQFSLGSLGATVAFGGLLLWYAWPWALVAWVLAKTTRVAGPVNPWIATLFLTSVDSLRVAVDPFGLYLPAHALAAEPRLIQLCTWTGATGLSLWIYGLTALGVVGVQHWQRGQRRLASREGVCLAAWLALGLAVNVALLPPLSVAATTQTLRVAFVQEAARIDARPGLAVLVAQSVELVRAQRPDLLLWPEGTLAGAPAADGEVLLSLWEAMVGTELTLVTGGLRQVLRDGRPIAHNSVFAVRGAGVVIGEADKQVLVPFGEYVPEFLRWFGLSETTLRRHFGAVTLSPGVGLQRPLRGGGVQLGPLICNEILLPALAQRASNGGAQLLVNLSNDRWARSAAVARLMVRAAQLRAVEMRLPVVRSASPGGAAVVDPAGRVVWSADWLTRVATVVPVVVERGSSLHRRVEPWVQVFLGLAALAVFALGRHRATAA